MRLVCFTVRFNKVENTVAGQEVYILNVRFGTQNIFEGWVDGVFLFEYKIRVLQGSLSKLQYNRYVTA
jgi:hypothetical protein